MGDPPRRAAHTPYPRRGLFFHISTGIQYHIQQRANKDRSKKHRKKLRQGCSCLDPPKIYHKNTISCKYIVCNNQLCVSDLYKIAILYNWPMFQGQNYTIRLSWGDPLLPPAACAYSRCRMTCVHHQGVTGRTGAV